MTRTLDLLKLGEAAGSAPAVDCPGGSGLTYGELRALADRCRPALGWHGKALIVVDAPRSRTGLLGYLAALRAGHAVILAEEGGPALWDEIIMAYQPELLIATPGGSLAGLARRLGFRLRTDNPLPVWKRPDGDTVTPIHPDLGLLARTSGSLGPPKMVRLSYGNLRASATAVAEAHALRGGDRAMTSLPLDFSVGLSMVNSAFAAGASVAVSAYSPSSEPFWGFLDHAGGTCAAAVPATYRFLRDRGWDPAAHPTLRLLLHSGGAPEEAALAYYGTRMRAVGGDFVATYGQTEASRIAYLPATTAAAHPTSAGVAVPGAQITIEGPGGQAPAGETGEIVVEGPGVMMGYARTRADLAVGDVQGDVLRTGDLGCLRDGLLYLTGRMDRQVKVFGRRIDLDQAESKLLARGLTAVIEAVSDERLVVAAEPAAAGLSGECMALARRLGLPSAAVRGIRLNSLPYNSHGKIDRLAVRRALTGKEECR